MEKNLNKEKPKSSVDLEQFPELFAVLSCLSTEQFSTLFLLKRDLASKMNNSLNKKMTKRGDL